MIWVLERMVNGRRYSRSLDARNVTDARAELALFDRDPDAYLTRAEHQAKQAADAVTMGEESIGRCLAHLKQAGTTELYRRDVRRYLARWAVDLAGRDLRKTKLADYKAALSKHKTARKGRIIALKTFTAYLREEGLLTTAEDSTLDLLVPPPRPEKALRDKGYSVEHVQAVYAQIDSQPVRDVVCLMAKTGMHLSEVERLGFGEAKVQVVAGQGEIAGTVRFVHKTGRIHTNSLDAQCLAAAARLQARKAAPRKSTIQQAIAYAAKRAKVQPINPGELRHSFVTWASESGVEVRPKEGGLPLSVVAAAVGHQSTRTTKLYYEGVKVPIMVKVPIALVHPDDPPATAAT